MMNRRSIAQMAVAQAFRTRQKGGYSLKTPICVYDLAERLKIEVRFVDLPSMEGMYINTPNPHIILSSLRPSGRRAFTCAHEIAHHIRNDGIRVDQVLDQKVDSRFNHIEFAADCFAGALLMPKTAVERAFFVRDWKINQCTAAQAYAISNYFGVGYSTIVHHLNSSLLLLPDTQAEKLLKYLPRQAQALAIGWETADTVWVVDRHWIDRSIDAEVDDLIYLPGNPRLDDDCGKPIVEVVSDRLLRVVRQGIARIEDNSGWSAFIRTSKRAYVGRSIFRNLEEEEE